MLLLLPTLLPLLLSGCTTEMDCELSGDCVGGVCHCDVGWKGVTCSELDLVSMIYIYIFSLHVRRGANITGSKLLAASN